VFQQGDETVDEVEHEEQPPWLRRQQLEQEAMVIGEDVFQTMGLVWVFHHSHVFELCVELQLVLQIAIVCIDSMVI